MARVVLFDCRGFEIKEGDILKVFHFKHGKRRKYYMWKIVQYNEQLGWVGIHTGEKIDLNKGYSLKSQANQFNILLDSEIVSRDICFEADVREGKRKQFSKI